MSKEERKWLDNAVVFGGSFISNFADACFRADYENFALLQPVLAQMMAKYQEYSRDLRVGKAQP